MPRECPSCATEIEPVDGGCPICGYEFAEKPRLGVKFVALILILLSIYPFFKLIRFAFGY